VNGKWLISLMTCLALLVIFLVGTQPAGATNGDRRGGKGDKKIGICHATGSTARPFVFLEVDEHAVEAHRAHGDMIGVRSEEACPRSKPTAVSPQHTPTPRATNTVTPEASATSTSTLTPLPFATQTVTPTVIVPATSTNTPTPTSTVPAQAGDSFPGIGTLSIPGSAIGSTSNATTESGEPQPSCAPIGKTVWYRVVPSAAGVLTASTAGSSFDTVLAIYTGSSLNALAERACNDDEDYFEGVLTSRLEVVVSAGETYYLQLGGYDGDSGNFQLLVTLDSGQTTLPTASPTRTPTVMPTAVSPQPAPTYPTVNSITAVDTEGGVGRWSSLQLDAWGHLSSATPAKGMR
jgi:hypothetical protein